MSDVSIDSSIKSISFVKHNYLPAVKFLRIKTSDDFISICFTEKDLEELKELITEELE